MTPRDNTLDIAKGISIILVVIFHMLRSFVASGLIQNSPLVNFVDTAIYGIHIHAFFFISGYLYFRKDRLKFPTVRIYNLYYPYILWSILSFSILQMAPTEHPLGLTDLLLLPVWPIQHYWFVLSLIICYALLFWFSGSLGLAAITICSLALDAIALRLHAHPFVTSTLYFIPFAALGAYFGAHGLPPLQSGWALLGLGMWLLGAWLAIPDSMKMPQFVLFSAGGLYALFYLSSVLARFHLGNFFCHFGVQSLPVFLTHVIFGTGTKIVLYKLDQNLNPWLGLCIVIAVSAVAPLVFAEAIKRMGLEKIAGFKPMFPFTRIGVAQNHSETVLPR